MMSIDENILKKRINEALNEGKHKLSSYELDKLVEEVNIYHRELEFQNEELKRIQIELEQSNYKLNSIFNDAPVGYAIINSEFEIQQANATLKKLFGLGSIEKGTKFTDFVNFDHQDRFYLFFRRFKEGKLYDSIEVNMVTPTRKFCVLMDVNDYYEMGELFYRLTITDITERRKVELKLSKSEALFKALFDKHSAIKLIIDPKTGNIIDANMAAVAFYGYPKNDLVGTNISKLNKLRNDEIKDKLGNIHEEKEFTLVVPHVLVDGQVRVVEIFGNYITDDEGEGIIHMIIHDITSKAEAENKVKLLSRSVEQSPASVFITNPNGDIEYVNPAFTKITGYSFDEVIGKNPRLLKSGAQHNDFYKHLWVTITSGKDWKGEMLNKKKDGTLYWEETIISPILDDEKRVTHFVATKLDVTKRKVDQTIILQREANITAILENTMDSIWSVDREYRIQYINNIFLQNFKNTFGMELRIGEVILNYLPSDISESWKKSYDMTFNGEHIVFEDVIKFGEITVYVEVSMMPIVIDEKVVGASIYGRDITQKKLYELDLIQAKERAEESDRLKSAFLANMSHEIRTPINGILGFTDLLKDLDVNLETRTSYLNIIHKAGNRLLDTVNDLIDISKIETGQMPVIYSDVKLNSVIENFIDFFEPQFFEKRLEFINKTSAEIRNLTLRTDEIKLNSILTNLIKNAIKYTDQGFVSLEIRLKNGEVRFEVADSGIGIPLNRQEAIFNRFEQADISDKRALQGSGLGLSISKAYVEMLGGQIWVESEEAKGSKFFFTLPIEIDFKNNDESNGWQAKPSTKKEATRLKVLIAEDDELSATYLSLILKDKTREIYICKSGAEAVDYMMKHKDVDLVLMDLKMPGMNGYEATRKIRQFNHKVAIIAQTAYALVGDKDKALDAGCDAYISKPINAKELLKLIDKVIV